MFIKVFKLVQFEQLDLNFRLNTMKYLACFVLMAIAGIAHASPIAPPKEPRWALIPNEDGKMILGL